MPEWAPQASVNVVGGTYVDVDTSLITRAAEHPAPVEVLATVLVGFTAISKDEPSGRRLARFHFLDPTATGVGQRVQSYTVNDAPLIVDLDVFDQTDAVTTELVVDVVYEHTGGTVTVLASASTGQTCCSGVEFLDGTGMNLTIPGEGGGGGGQAGVPNDLFLYEVYNTVDFTGPVVLTGTEATIFHQWLNEGPFGGQVDNVTIRWRGNFNFTTASYRFTCRVDDGVRLYVDGDEKLTSWVEQAPTTYTADVAMTAGYHEIKVEYLELAGWAVCEVGWALLDPLAGTFTFTGSDGDTLGAGWTVQSDAGTPPQANNRADIRSNRMALRVIHTGAADQYTLATRAAAYTDYRTTGEVRVSTTGVYSATIEMRHSGTYAPETGGNTSGVNFSLGPSLNEIVIGQRTYDPGTGISTYVELNSTPFTTLANTTYFFRCELEGTAARMWVGTGTFDNVWSLTATTTVAGPGVNVSFFNGDHYGGSGTQDVLFDNIALIDIGVGGGGGGQGQPLGDVKLGICYGNDVYQTQSYANLFGAAVEVLSIYIDTRYIDETSNWVTSGITDWLLADSNRRCLVGCNIMYDDPGNFENAAINTQMVQLANDINSQGIENQIILRPAYEMNHGFGFPYQPRYFGPNNFTRFINMWRSMHTAVKAVCPEPLWDFCVVPWDDVADWISYTPCWPGDAYVDVVGADPYPDYAYNGSHAADLAEWDTRLQSVITFADAHGKLKSIDESAMCSPSAGHNAYGDDPEWIDQMAATMIADDFSWWVYFDVGTAQQVSMYIHEAPLGLARWNAFWQTQL